MCTCAHTHVHACAHTYTHISMYLLKKQMELIGDSLCYYLYSLNKDIYISIIYKKKVKERGVVKTKNHDSNQVGNAYLYQPINACVNIFACINTSASYGFN